MWSLVNLIGCGLSLVGDVLLELVRQRQPSTILDDHCEVQIVLVNEIPVRDRQLVVQAAKAIAERR